MENTKLTEYLSKKRFQLSIIILFSSLFLLLLMLCIINPYNWKIAFTAIVGLVGTWVGTVLAFYFSKENFDAASASTQKLVDSITSTQKLESTKVDSVMIPLKDINSFPFEKNKEKLIKIRKNYLEENNRLPIFTSKSIVSFIFHKSLIDEFITDKAIAGETTSELTLNNLLSDSFFKMRGENFATIKISDSLNTAKILMENLSSKENICSDIFVTTDGTKNTKVIGWVTNKVIEEYSKV